MKTDAFSVAGRPGSLTPRLKQLIQIGIALTSERDLPALLERIVGEARRFTNAEAGTLFLRNGDTLRVAVVQNERRSGAAEMRWRLERTQLPIDGSSLAGHVALTGDSVALPDAGDLPADLRTAFTGTLTAPAASETRSLLVVPMHDAIGDVTGVLELMNARDEAGAVVPFDREYTVLVRALAAQAAIAIRNARLEELSFKDPLTGAYNRRYFTVRIEEEGRRQARFGEPLSLVLIALDHCPPVDDRRGHGATEELLREAAELIIASSRAFSIVTRYGGDEFAVLLVNTPKADALRYAERLKEQIEGHAFPCGAVTVSIGVASMPADARTTSDLVPAADRALYGAKRLGGNAVEHA